MKQTLFLPDRVPFVNSCAEKGFRQSLYDTSASLRAPLWGVAIHLFCLHHGLPRRPKGLLAMTPMGGRGCKTNELTGPQ